MFTVDDQAAGPRSKVPGPGVAADHERLVLEPRDVEFDWAKLPFHYVPNQPFATHVLNVLHLLLVAKQRNILRSAGPGDRAATRLTVVCDCCDD
jgi:uncharacterized protein